MPSFASRVLGLVLCVFALGCSERDQPRTGGFDASVDAARPDMSTVDVPFDPDAACASTSAIATVERQPVDIIFVVDNSSSMQPAIDAVTSGINAFANMISERDLDYKVIMLSLRGHGRTTMTGSTRYAVCVPQPLAGNTNCGNGDRFFQSSIDIKSTQPLEQFLGTLGQTTGYTSDRPAGGEAWRDQLRAGAAKSIVVVTDDNARTCALPGSDTMCQSGDPMLTTLSLENFPGGANPFNSNVLPKGILDPVWEGIFEGYTFSAIYGWQSESNPDTICMYEDGSSPPNSGPTYTTLVERTGGARARICDGSDAWTPFFEDIANTVDESSGLSCEIAIPAPPEGMSLDPARINVEISSSGTSTGLRKVANEAACGTQAGWYYDNDTAPTTVTLCPSACSLAETIVRAGGGNVNVQFGCGTLLF